MTPTPPQNPNDRKARRTNPPSPTEILEIVPTEDLVRELIGRFPTLILFATRNSFGDVDKENGIEDFIYRIEGSRSKCMGLATLLLTRCSEELEDSFRPDIPSSGGLTESPYDFPELDDDDDDDSPLPPPSPHPEFPT